MSLEHHQAVKEKVLVTLKINAHSFIHICLDTAEYKTIIHCTPALRTVIEHNLTELSGHMLAKDLITFNQEVELRNRMISRCERAASLVQFVTVKVEQNSDKYHIFINVLEEDKVFFREILKLLNNTYNSFAGPRAHTTKENETGKQYHMIVNNYTHWVWALVNVVSSTEQSVKIDTYSDIMTMIAVPDLHDSYATMILVVESDWSAEIQSNIILARPHNTSIEGLAQ